MEKLQNIFSQISYFGIEQITKGVNKNFDSSGPKKWQIDDIRFGISGVEYVNECIKLFTDSVKRLDEEFAESIKKEMGEFMLVMSDLKDLLLIKLSTYAYEVFVSYAWNDESERIVNDLEQAFAESDISIVRDKKDISYKDSIQAFEQRMGRGQRVILIISDKYLRSDHCMYELVEVNENQNFHKRIFPIVLADARIYDPVDRMKYIKYWEEKIKKLNQSIKEVEVMTSLNSASTSLNNYARIRASFDNLVDLLGDMYTLTPEVHESNGFITLVNAVKRPIEISDREAKQLQVWLKYVEVKLNEFKKYAKQLDDKFSE